MAATRTTISLDDSVAKAAAHYCEASTMKFSNLVETLLTERLRTVGYLPEADESTSAKAALEGALLHVPASRVIETLAHLTREYAATASN